MGLFYRLPQLKVREELEAGVGESTGAYLLQMWCIYVEGKLLYFLVEVPRFRHII